MCWRYFPRFLFSPSYHQDQKQMLDLLHTPALLLNFLRITVFLHQTSLLFLPPVPEYHEVGVNLPVLRCFSIFTAHVSIHHIYYLQICECTYMASCGTFFASLCPFSQVDPYQSIINLVYLLTAHPCINKALSFPSSVKRQLCWSSLLLFSVEGDVQAAEPSLRVEVCCHHHEDLSNSSVMPTVSF